MNADITIITAFFDIGRGGWTADQGHPSYLQRSTEKYFSYFKRLAALENPMVVFVAPEHKEAVLAARGTKTTTVVEWDLPAAFPELRNRISTVQQNPDFRSRISPEQLKNPEYWSADYVLVTTSKAFFVCEAARRNLIGTAQAAWIDFGYCREKKTLCGLKKWQYPFNLETVHLFTIHDQFDFQSENILNAILDNQVFIIGGAMVATPEKWQELDVLTRNIQMRLLDENIVDDDQGILLSAVAEQTGMFTLNYLGHDNWFGLFERFADKPHHSLLQKLKHLFGR